MKENPKVSVIIPVYNSAKDLPKCLESLIDQTYRNLEIVLIDDGSTDNSSKICDQFADRDSRFVCIHKENEGVSKARNVGIEVATGDYYHFLDSDDYIEPDAYEYLLDLMQEHKCDAVNFEYYGTFPDKEIVHLLSDSHYGLFEGEDIHLKVIQGEPFAWNKLFSQKLITSTNSPGIEKIQFREDIYRGEDSLFAHEALDNANCVWFDKRPLYHYVQSEESACRGSFRVSQLSALKLYDAYTPLYQEKYPNLWEPFAVGMLHLLVTLYCDMWFDAKNYSAEQRMVHSRFREEYTKIKNSNLISKKNRIKFSLFNMSPNIFCKVHKRIHY